MRDDRIRFMADDLTLAIANPSGGIGHSGFGINDFNITDIRELQKRLKAIEPRLRTELVREAKAVAKPIESGIKSAIGNVTPLSGMLKDKGRLGWGNGMSPSKTLIQWRTSASGKSLTTSLVRVKVSSPGTVLADMAGRSGRYVGKGRRNDNATPSIKRRNANPRKGEAFITSLNEKIGHAASRFIWPSAESSLPQTRNAIEQVLRRAYDKINKEGL